MKTNNNGYANSLSKKILEGLIKIQTDPKLKYTRPRLSGSGFLFKPYGKNDTKHIFAALSRNYNIIWALKVTKVVCFACEVNHKPSPQPY